MNNRNRRLLEDLLLERGIRLTNATKVGEFVAELDDLIDELLLLRLATVMGAGTCGNPDCPVHGSRPEASVRDPLAN